MTSSTNGLQTKRLMPKLHKVRVPTADGLAEYWYAWRGGPRILVAHAKSDAALDAEVARIAPGAIARFHEMSKPENGEHFSALIVRYLKSPEYGDLAPRTQKDRRKFLDLCRDKWGTLPIAALNSGKMRAVLIKWRNEFSDTPKSADERLTAMSAVLTWAHDNGEVEGNVLSNFPRIYHADRSAIIWTPEDLDRLFAHCGQDLRDAIDLALHTGSRVSDLRALAWSNVGRSALTYQPSKGNKKRTAIIPITPRLRAVLDRIPRRKSTTILTSSRGYPWTEPGLSTAFQKAKRAAGITGLRFHDLRGTAATNLIRAGMPLDDLAEILGWTTAQVKEIARRYVSSDAMADGMLKRWETATRTEV